MRRGLEGISRRTIAAFRNAGCVAAVSLLSCVIIGGSTANAVDDSYRPPGDTYSGQGGGNTYSEPPPGDRYQPEPPPASGGDYAPYNGGRARDGDQGGYGAPYAPPPSASRDGGGYYDGPPP
ncbi:MAG: DUF1134 domain-containing protein, partial [Hyphomicrobium sp.]